MRLLSCLLLGLSPALVLAAPAIGLDALAAYAGVWHSEVHHLGTPYSKAGTKHVSLRNDCWRARAFYACEQSVDGKPIALLVYLHQAGVTSPT